MKKPSFDWRSRSQYVIYARYPSKDDRLLVTVHPHESLARLWLERMLKGEEYVREGMTVTTTSGIILTSHQMAVIINAPDHGWELDEQYVKPILQFKLAPYWEKPPEPEPGDTPPVDDDTEQPPPVAKPAPKPAKASKASVPDGYVKLTDLATTWGVPASDCRAILRGSGREKPAYGWAFGPKDIPAIKKLCGVKK